MSWYPVRKTKRDQVDVRHERAMDIADQDVVALGETQWQVNSQGGGGRGAYTIHLENVNCPRGSCRETQKCYAAGCRGLCEHMYRCTCPDNNNMCKHIHKVRILSIRATQTADQQAATAREDQDWRRECDVGREVARVRSILGEIRCYLDRYETDALEGVIGEAAEALAGISSRIFCHCEDYEREEEVGEEEEYAEEEEGGDEEEYAEEEEGGGHGHDGDYVDDENEGGNVVVDGGDVVVDGGEVVVDGGEVVVDGNAVVDGEGV